MTDGNCTSSAISLIGRIRPSRTTWLNSAFRDTSEIRRPSNDCMHLGLELSEDEVKAKAGSDSIGRPHIAQVLIDKGYVRNTREAFDRYLGEGAAAYVPRTLADTP